MNQLVGNDIVDLNTSDAINYPKNLRFIKRVLCEQEQQDFFDHSNSSILFWKYWAAKEAVFKIIKKIDPNTTFAHRLFQVTLEKNTQSSASGYVTYRDTRYNIIFTLSPGWIHCVATNGNNFGKIVYQVIANNKITCDPNDFTADETASIFSPESFLVRRLVKNIFRAHNGTNCEIRRQPLLKKFGPPEIWINGEKKDIDLSMSHDGNYCAGLILFKS
jgi:phosphopantetheine--protein transferase-like protein